MSEVVLRLRMEVRPNAVDGLHRNTSVQRSGPASAVEPQVAAVAAVADTVAEQGTTVVTPQPSSPAAEPERSVKAVAPLRSAPSTERSASVKAVAPLRSVLRVEPQSRAAEQKRPLASVVSKVDVGVSGGTIADPKIMGYRPPGSVITGEPRRDRAFGIFTGHRTFVVVCMIAISAALYYLQQWAWPSGARPASALGRLWEMGSILWVAPLVPGLVGLVGLMWFRHPDDLDDVTPISQLVVFRIVTRGTNAEALGSTIRRCRAEMEATPLFRYLIEVVTDAAGSWGLGTNDVMQIVVPSGYETKARSLFKARALQYAVENSKIPNDAWLVHLDEETCLTSSGIKGIARMIGEEEAAGTMRIGQGAILYHRNWEKHPFLTMADNVRTGDDFGRFHFQHRTGRTLFGLHGSFIVCRNDIAREIGFDFGPDGSITEDAFWALVAMERGHRARWVEGYLEEQSTQSVGDFMRQRRRWFQGLWKVSIHAPVNIRYRLALMINTVLWSLAPLSFLYTIAHFFTGYKVPLVIQIIANLTWAAFATLYLVGMKANLDEHEITNPIKRVGWYVMQAICMPFFAMMEAASVLLAIVRPHAGFHVVKK
jgi:beta-1,4-mannosyltransferase